VDATVSLIVNAVGEALLSRTWPFFPRSVRFSLLPQQFSVFRESSLMIFGPLPCLRRYASGVPFLAPQNPLETKIAGFYFSARDVRGASLPSPLVIFRTYPSPIFPLVRRRNMFVTVYGGGVDEL